MKIILDAMGGDNAPQATVLGAVAAAKDFGADITLVGRENEILQVLKDNGMTELPKGISIFHAEDVVDMHDDPAAVVRKRKDSSMVVGLKMLSQGEGDAFISAGSTGALLTGATLVVKRVKGIRRAAMGPCMPNKAGGKTVLLDCGANAECTPEFLLQFGMVGSAYVADFQDCSTNLTVSTGVATNTGTKVGGFAGFIYRLHIFRNGRQLICNAHTLSPPISWF